MKKKNPHSRDYFAFLEEIRDTGPGAVLIGGLLLIVFALFLGMVGSRELWKSGQYYRVVFELNFVEDILPGTRVRYQGSVPIGEVLYIERGPERHYVHAKIRKNFQLPINGSIITIESWGYFGASFINVEILESFRGTTSYGPGDKIRIEDTINTTAALWELYYFFRSEEESISQLERELLRAKLLTSTVSRSPLFRRGEIRKTLSHFTGETQRVIKGMRTTMQSTYDAFYTFQNYSDETVERLKKNIYQMRRQSEFWQKQVSPDELSPAGEWLHEENQYYKLLYYSIMARDLSKKYKAKPSSIVYGD